MTSKFDHALSSNFVSLLAAEAEERGWWAEVLADPKLVIALRGSYLNVYYRGQSLFYVEAKSSSLKVTTHEKYLLDPALAGQVPLVDGKFDVDKLLEKGFIKKYRNKETLPKMKKAASLFSGLEKTGCHEIAVRNPMVIDCEIAFPGVDEPIQDGDKKGAPRIDLACVEPYGDHARLVFWEAKHYSNGELRAAGEQPPPVCGQIATYRNYLSAHREVIVDSYTRVARNLLDISKMGSGRPISPLIAGIGSGTRRLDLGDEPKVGLIIFGYDEGQRVHPGWQDQLKKLKKEVAWVRAVGDAKQIRL